MARFPLTIALIRPGGTARSRARRMMLMSRGFMNSSSRISPGWIGSSNFLGAISFLNDSRRFRGKRRMGESFLAESWEKDFLVRGIGYRPFAISHTPYAIGSLRALPDHVAE